MALLAVLMAACASGRTQPGGMESDRWSGDPRLYEILKDYPMSAAQQDSLAAYAAEHLSAVGDRLADAAEDTRAPASVRVNAIMTLASRREGVHLPLMRELLDDEDVRIRATATAAMREFVHTHPFEAVRIARVALADPEPDVQAQALQIVGDDDIDLLRDYIPAAANDELRAVARDLVRVAEERGAPLRGDSASGELRRETSSGYTVTFTPHRRWQDWQAAVGDVVIAREGTTVARLDSIEAVARVLPVFFSADGRHIVYERARSVAVLELATGDKRELGEGVAPRVRPFTDTFVFFRQAAPPEDLGSHHRVRYHVVLSPFEAVAGQPEVVYSTQATMTFGTRGAYSPVRWMRVEERAGHFYLTAAGLDMVALPDPFAPGD